MTTRKHKPTQRQNPLDNPYILESYNNLLDALYEFMNNIPKDEHPSVKSAQAIAAIALADQFLSKMPVEMAFEYRQLAKQFSDEIDFED